MEPEPGYQKDPVRARGNFTEISGASKKTSQLMLISLASQVDTPHGPAPAPAIAPHEI